MAKEIWKRVPGFVHYSASNFGRIKSEWSTGRILKATPLRHGYLQISLYCNGQKQRTVHRVVWEAFKGKIPVELQINHIDGNKRNNALSNLELATPSENRVHSFKIGTSKTGHGSRSPQHKLTEEIVLAIRKGHALGEAQKALGQRYGVTQSAVSYVVNRKVWRHI